MDKATVQRLVNAWFCDSEQYEGCASSFVYMLNNEYPEYKFTYSIQTSEILVD